MSTIGSSDIDGSVQFLVVNQDPSSFPVDCSAGSVVIYNDLWYRKLDDGSSTNFTTTSFSGASGFSGFSGASGFSGYSGGSGVSGFSAPSGVSGFSATATPTSPAGGSFNGSFPSPGLAPDSVTASILADGAITNKKYGAESVHTIALAPTCVTLSKVRKMSITTSCIADGCFRSGKFAAGSIFGQSKAIAPQSITTAKLLSNSYFPLDFAAGSLENKHLQNGSITTLLSVPASKIGASSIQSIHIANSAVSGPLIEDNAIKTINISDRAISGLNFQNDALTTEKFSDNVVSGDHVRTKEIKINHIKDKTATTKKIKNNAITSSKIDDLVIDVDLLKDASIEQGKIALGAITTAKITNASVTSSKIKLNEIQGGSADGKFADFAINANKRTGASGGFSVLGDPSNYTLTFTNGLLEFYTED